MSLFSISKLHSHLRKSRSRTEKTKDPEFFKRMAHPKSYPRMEQISLPTPSSDVLLADALRARKSTRAYATTPVPMRSLSNVLGLALYSGGAMRRPHPSGGGCYPIETYLFISGVEDVSRGVYHYRPDIHVLERLWDAPQGIETTSLIYDARFTTTAPILFILTAQWEKTLTRYDDFGLELALLEAGHIGQNLVLAAAAENLGISSLGDFKDEALSELLDLDPLREQVLYTFPAGIARS